MCGDLDFVFGDFCGVGEEEEDVGSECWVEYVYVGVVEDFFIDEDVEGDVDGDLLEWDCWW